VFALVEPIDPLALLHGADNAFLLPELAVPAKLIAVFETDMQHIYTALFKIA
jgi:hypothetical protein